MQLILCDICSLPVGEPFKVLTISDVIKEKVSPPQITHMCLTCGKLINDVMKQRRLVAQYDDLKFTNLINNDMKLDYKGKDN